MVWDAPAGPTVPDRKLKPVTRCVDAPPMRGRCGGFIDWVAGYTLAAPGEVLAMALRVNALAPAAVAAGRRLAARPIR